MVQLSTLIELFYPDPLALGRFTEVPATEVPQPQRDLLGHRHHMTVTVEAHHGSSVDVQVLDRNTNAQAYARKILLKLQSNGRVVQYGIMRVNFAYLSEAVRKEIESEAIPLGRVLIDHNVLREIELNSLWKIEPGPELCQLFSISPDQIVYGRTAIIRCNGEPGIELLEIVTP